MSIRMNKPNRCYVVLLVQMITLLLSVGIEPSYGQNDALVVSSVGEVQAQHPQTALWATVNSGDRLGAGTTIRTGPSGKCAIVFSDETLMRLNSNTTFFLKEVSSNAGWLNVKSTSNSLGGSSSYLLERGELWLRNKNKNTAIEVSTPSISASIRGTEFNILHLDNQQTVLSVLEGTVTASNKVDQIILAKNEQIVATATQPFTKTLLLSPNDSVQWVLGLPLTPTPADMPLHDLTGNKLRENISALESRLSSDPNNVALISELAALYRDTGEGDKAEALSQRALSLNPQFAPARTVFGTVLLDKGSALEAAAQLEGVANPNAVVFSRLIAAYRVSKNIDEARATLHRAEQSYPEDQGIILQNALLLLETEGPSSANRVLVSLTATHPHFAPGWWYRALCEIALQNKSAAQESAQRAVTLAPQSVTAHIVLSEILQGMLQFDDARKAIDQALRLSGSHSLALLNQAKLMFGNGELDRALTVITRAAELFPTDAEIQNVRGFILLAHNRSTAAREAFEQSTRLQSTLGEPHLGLSLLAMRQGHTAEALQEISAAVALEPRRSMFLSYWAKMLYQLRRFTQALDMLELASNLDPQDPTPFLYKAIIFRDLNRPTEAIEALQTAFQLNDNRAVYRSSFLLDRDLAVKNVDLSILYSQLGLAQWAFSNAVNSVKLDYFNHSAHLFLSGSYSDLEARDTARDTELLLAQIMLPANNNSFNTYNDYTSFLETPSYRGSISGAVGNMDYQEANAVLNGGFPESGIAAGVSVSRDQTDGYRETNTREHGAGATSFKIDPTLNDSFFLGAVSTESESADDFRSDYEIDAPLDPLDKSKSRGTSATLGYRHRFGANSNFIGALQYSKTWFQFDNHYLYDFELDDGTVPIEEFSHRIFDEQSYALQGQYQYRVGAHQFLLGAIFNWGDSDQAGNATQNALIDGESFPVNETESSSNQDQRFAGYYGYHIWTPVHWLSTEIGLYQERIEVADGFSDTKNAEEGFDPRAGIILHVTKQDTIRLAAYRYIVPFLSSPRFDPSDIAGITVYRNTLQGTTANEIASAWEHSWNTGFLGTNVFYLDRESSFRLDKESDPIVFDGRYRGTEIALNQLLFNGAGLSTSYRYLHADDEFDSDINREDHLVKMAIQYLHSSGIGGKIAQSYRRENFFDSPRNDEDIWITDMRLTYEFPHKVAGLSLGVNNIFDERFNWITGTGNIIGRVPSREIFARLTFNF